MQLEFHPTHSPCYSFEHTFPSTIINAINDVDSLECFLEQNKTEYPEKIEYKQRTEYPCEICGYKSTLNVICKSKMSKRNIAMSSGGKGKISAQPNICGIC